MSGTAFGSRHRVRVLAMLDRLLHHSIIFNIQGDSYRIKGKKEDPPGNFIGHGSEPGPGASSRAQRKTRSGKTL